MKMAVYNHKTLLNNYFSDFKLKYFFQNNKRNRGVVHLLLHLSTSSQKRATMAAQHRRLLRILLGNFILSMNCLKVIKTQINYRIGKIITKRLMFTYLLF